MKLEYTGVKIHIDDDSPEAVKIRQGYDWDFVARKIIIKSKTEYDIDAFQKKLELGTVTLPEIQGFIKELLKVNPEILIKKK